MNSQCDLTAPTELDNPLIYSLSLPAHQNSIKREPQTSLLPYMPPHVLSSIAGNLLEPSGPIDHKPAKQLDDLLAFCRSCTSFRALDLPEQTWRQLTLDAVNRYRNEQCQRWRANPSGVGGVTQVWIAIDKHVVEPVEVALKRAEHDHRSISMMSLFDDSLDDVARLSARDVLYWWLYSDAWRSRRRVWHSVVHACAAACNADWW